MQVQLGRRVLNKLRYYELKYIHAFSKEEILDTFDSRYYENKEFCSVFETVKWISQCLVSPKRKREIIESLELMQYDSIEKGIKEADAICQHVFDLFGKSYFLGESINWHKDYVSGYQWPLKFHRDIKIISLSDNSDIKFPWELNRFFHAVTLGKAYYFSGDEKYTDEFVEQIKSWIVSNPVSRGVNWNCSMEVGIRVINLIWAYCFFFESKKLSAEFHTLLLNLILAHGKHIFKNLENKFSVKGNHYLGNLLGLLYIGSLFNIYKYSKRWKAFALGELVKAIDDQVYEDGTSFESSIPYHRLVTEMFLHATLLLTFVEPHSNPAHGYASLKSLGEKSFGRQYIKKLEKMCEFILSYTKPDGSAPQIGDNDNSRLVRLGRNTDDINDHRHILAIAGELFDRDDFRFAGRERCEEAIWLFGGQIKPVEKEEPELDSRGFADAGIYIMRKEKNYIIVRCGRLGTGGKGTHTHNDNLSFELCADGITYIVDPGTFEYSRDVRMRNLLRSTEYHNALVIDEEEQNNFSETDIFVLHKNSETKVLFWKPGNDEDYFIGENVLNLKRGGVVTHRREIKFDKVNRNWKIKDRVVGKGKHDLVWNFHGNEGILIEVKNEYVAFRSTYGGGLNMTLSGIKNYTTNVVNGLYSPSFNVKKEIQKLRLFIKTELPVEINFDFYLN